jgi:hypothetical protein
MEAFPGGPQAACILTVSCDSLANLPLPFLPIYQLGKLRLEDYCCWA